MSPENILYFKLSPLLLLFQVLVHMRWMQPCLQLAVYLAVMRKNINQIHIKAENVIIDSASGKVARLKHAKLIMVEC